MYVLFLCDRSYWTKAVAAAKSMVSLIQLIANVDCAFHSSLFLPLLRFPFCSFGMWLRGPRPHVDRLADDPAPLG